jgi:hypothetical protein
MRQLCVGFALACAALLCAPTASAQNVITTVLRDPVAYAPAAAKYVSMQLDWNSSQPFFRHGFIERNKSFTVSGQPFDTPLAYAAGNRKIAVHTGVMFGQWFAINVAERSLEQFLIRRYESHRKTVLVAGRVARVMGASFLTYTAANGHVRQWRTNERMAKERGF